MNTSKCLAVILSGKVESTNRSVLNTITWWERKMSLRFQNQWKSSLAIFQRPGSKSFLVVGGKGGNTCKWWQVCVTGCERGKTCHCLQGRENIHVNMQPVGSAGKHVTGWKRGKSCKCWWTGKRKNAARRWSAGENTKPLVKSGKMIVNWWKAREITREKWLLILHLTGREEKIFALIGCDGQK